MSTTGSIALNNFTHIHISSRNKFDSTIFIRSRLSLISKHMSISTNQTSQSLQVRDLVVYSSIQPGLPPLPSNPSPGSWKVWILGTVIALAIPFLKNKWWPLLRLKKEVEAAIEIVEQVTDVIEDVAEGVEKVADLIGDQLPEGGQLKDAANVVENLARVAAKNAQFVEDIIDKIQEVEKEVESLIDPDIAQTQTNETTKE